MKTIIFILVSFCSLQLFAQNVGIGTTTPKRLLHVNGDYYGKGNVWLHAFEGDGNSGTAYLQAGDDSGSSSIGMQLRTQNNGNLVNAMRILPNGNVGINTASFNTALNVRNPFSGTFRILNVESADGTDRFVVTQFGNSGFNALNSNIGLTVRNPSAFNFQILNVESADGTDRFVVYETGNAGFNHSFTNVGLNVRNPLASNPVILNVESAAGTYRFQVLETGNAGFNQSFNNVGLNVRNPSATNLFIINVASANGTARFQVLETGNAGFNTVLGHVGLNVRNPSATNPFILNVESANGTARFQVRENGTAGFNQAFSNVALNVRNPSASNNTIFRVVDSDGFPRFRVTDDDNIFAKGLPFGDHANMQYAPSDGQFFYDNSSRRYKRNIQPLEDDFMLILKAQPKTYTRPDDPDRWEVGYIAEEMDSLGLTKLVSYDTAGIPDGFNYEKMILYVNEILKVHEDKLLELEAVKQEIAELKQNREQSQQAVANLQKEMEALKALVVSKTSLHARVN